MGGGGGAQYTRQYNLNHKIPPMVCRRCIILRVEDLSYVPLEPAALGRWLGKSVISDTQCRGRCMEYILHISFVNF